jgi:hypothetical protein
MKKTLLLASVSLLVASSEFKPAFTSAKAINPSSLKQVTPSAEQTPTKARIELLSAGSQPRQQLRFKPRLNVKERTNMTMTLDMSMSVDNQPMPLSKSPGTIITIETQTTKIDPNGDIHYQFAYTNADVVADATTPPATIESMRSQIKQLAGITGNVVIDNRGRTKQINLTLPPGLDPTITQVLNQMTDSMQQLSSLLPEEAIGIGGQWRVTESLTVSGMTITQAATYQLVSLKNGVATVNASLTQQAVPQTINLANMPSGVSYNLKSYAAQGQSQTTMSFNAIMPTSSSMSLTSTSAMEMKQTGATQPMQIGTKMSMQINLRSQP